MAMVSSSASLQAEARPGRSTGVASAKRGTKVTACLLQKPSHDQLRGDQPAQRA
jgi:hypothetical protein